MFITMCMGIPSGSSCLAPGPFPYLCPSPTSQTNDIIVGYSNVSSWRASSIGVPLVRRTALSRVTMARGGLCGDTTVWNLHRYVHTHHEKHATQHSGRPSWPPETWVLPLYFFFPLGPRKIALQSEETNTFQLFLSLQEERRTGKKIPLLTVLLKERRKWGAGGGS